MIPVPRRPLLDEILVTGAQDWVFEQDVYSLLKERSLRVEPVLLMGMSVGVIAQLLFDDLMLPTSFGEPWKEHGWKAVERIEREWRRRGPQRGDGVVVWLGLTTRGLDRAKATAASEGWEPKWRG